tara:strand:- start:457 stop:1293 length:837 start_codon:yes stop_codon:yes gene_type:complete
MTDRGRSRTYLRKLGDDAEQCVDIAQAALHLAALTRSQPDLVDAKKHLVLLDETLKRLVSDNPPANANAAAHALAEVLARQSGYRGDDQTYDDLQNADLLCVIKRRKGLPVALGILYMHLARSQDWTACGLSFPGHFLVALEFDGERTIVDPFHEGVVRTPSELRELLKMVAGQDAELDQKMFLAVPDRGVLLRLQGNIRLRQMQMGRFTEAADTLESMLLIAPEHAELWHEFGVLQTKLGNLGAAVLAFENAVERETRSSRRQEFAAILQQLQRRLN